VADNLRIIKAPPISHPDFHIWQYNATPQAMKYIDEPWEYAVYRQGYKDYNHRFTRADYDTILSDMKQNRQFFFIQPLTDIAKKFALEGDFENLAMRNTSTPGFGKADFVSYYLEWVHAQTK
jgi:hypothetical protein